MPCFELDGTTIHYEDHGEGEPLVVLNGIFMSCASWQAFVPSFSARNRLLLLDLVDQGASGTVDHEYTQELQERVVLAFLDHLGLADAHLCGVSYGGEVALRVATRHPDRVRKLVLANTTAHTSPWLYDIGKSWERAMASHDGHVFFTTCIPVVYSPGFYEANHDWIAAREEFFVRVFTPEVYDAFARLTRSAETHDERARLAEVTAPTLVISSEHDHVTPLVNQTELVAGIPGAAHVMIQGAGHAAMYEKPTEFTALVLGFVNHQTTGIAIS
ncbi:alpha/beta fold hydrolase [Isoptericola sp. b441]|uniref:Alpha/beta fold hydrolase n=1 Tax=Actinotalea lenta TaxID=3064654 RepID=A0ABT9DAK6_9CELL|nr:MULTISPECIES: alpha/beta fold hydrolase [unclassified Isoptericola]MDO8107590.1 alpha/beta fold hydrolase [Isoptericola sp. b441]MDO8120750.1 alpha/beta fold hydrolase [Isoptericola sp. b490]